VLEDFAPRRMMLITPRRYRSRQRVGLLLVPRGKARSSAAAESLGSGDEPSARGQVRRFASVIVLSSLALLVLTGAACQRKPATVASSFSSNPPAVAPARLIETSMTAVRFLESRVKADPDDLVALNKLANYYLQLYRETYDVTYLSLALRSARSSLQVLGPDQNLGGLDALAQAEYATHDFSSARDHAKELTEYQPRKSGGYLVMGDALLELGEYEQAIKAYARIDELDHGSVATETRLGRLAVLRGDFAGAERHFQAALAQATSGLAPTAESVAWCHWQLGETAFQAGDSAKAEGHYRDALTAYPKYARALASLGRAREAQGDRTGAIEQYERALRIVPDPTFAAALGDLYKLAGRNQDAARQYKLVEQIGKLNEFNGALYNRQLALFYADHDLLPNDAYTNAAKEYAVRRDVYGADALAWSALKSGKTAEAQAAIKEALRLGTRDARLFYHAGLIAKAAGDRGAAHEYLQQAMTLNPKFDPLQAEIAGRELEGTRPAN